MAQDFKSFFADAGGGEGERCNYTTQLDTYGCGCAHDCNYCVDPETLVLMYDGTHKQIKDIEIGDEIYGVVQDDKYTRYTRSIVVNKHWVEKPSYKITLANGRELVCSDDHRWLSNRGWKYTTGTEQGDTRRPHLTKNNRLIGFTSYDFVEYEETEQYKRGYIAGVMEGDGSVTEHHYDYGHRMNNQYAVRLAMKEYEAVGRAERYLADFGVDTQEFAFPMKCRDGITRNTTAIRTRKRENYGSVKEIIAERRDDEKSGDRDFMRGYLAGIYDAEGTSDTYIKRIYNMDDGIIAYVCKCLDHFGFSYTFDKEKHEKGGVLKTIRLLGGISESLRFAQVANPAIRSKFSFDGVAIKTRDTDGLRVVSIEKVADNQRLVDITTTTENFIANGCVSHNCYARSLLDFRGLWHPDNPGVASTDYISRKLRKVKPGTILRLGGMTDCFQPAEEVYGATAQAIRMMNARGIGYLIVTKSDLVASKQYMRLLDPELAHIQISVTSTSDEPNYLGEKAVAPSRRVEAARKLQEAGYDVSLRISPYVPELVDLKVLNRIEVNKCLVEFLRVNHWIEKWLGRAFPDHIVKSGGYKHLPLAIKRELLDGFRFPEMTVCEDVPSHYEWFKDNFNANPDDCCNLRSA